MQKKPEQIMLVHGEPMVIASFAKSIMQRFQINAHIALLDETISLGAAVSRPGAAKVRIPEPDITSRINVITQSLDELQAEFALLTERSKSAIRSAATMDERSRILDQYRLLLQKKADEILAKVH